MLNKFFLLSRAGLSALAACSLLTGCGKPTPVPEDSVDLREATEVFKAPAEPVVAPQPVIDATQIVATVNDRKIVLGQVQKEASILINRMQGQLPPEEIEKNQQQVIQLALNNLITQAVLLDEVIKEKIEVTPEELDERIAQIKKSLPTELTFEAYLQRMGLTEESLKAQLSSELQVNALIQSKIVDLPEVADAAVATFYTENEERFQMPELMEAEHFLVTLPPDTTDEVKMARQRRAQALRKRFMDGEELEALGKEVNANTPEDQPLLRVGKGRFVQEGMEPTLAKPLFALEADTFSTPIESPMGYHVFKVLSKSDAKKLTLEESTERIRTMLKQQASQAAVQAYLEEARKRATIEVIKPTA